MSITAGIKVARKLYQVTEKYKYLDPTNKFIRKYVPPGYRQKALRINKYLGISISGGLLYDVVDEILNGFSKQNVPVSPNKQYKKYKRNFKYNRSQYKHKSRCSCDHCRRRSSGKF